MSAVGDTEVATEARHDVAASEAATDASHDVAASEARRRPGSGRPPRWWARRWWVRRWWALPAVAVVLAVVAAFGSRGTSDVPLDPAGTTPTGSHAIATLLRARGITVVRVPTADAAVRAAAGRPVTVAVPDPSVVPDVQRLLAVSGRTVLFEPDGATLAAFAPGVFPADAAPREVVPPACPWPEAALAGAALTGGTTYDSGPSTRTGGVDAAAEPLTPTASCYPVAGHASVLVGRTSGREVVVVGNADLLSNENLADNGNAALAENLLSAHDTVLWVLPLAGEVIAEQTSDKPLRSYLPRRAVGALWTVVLAVALLALAYGRRLGRVVTERLPVVVRAAETVEGKARLYRAARAQDRAGGWLRDDALHALRGRIGLPPDAPQPAVVDAVAARTGRAREDVAATLFGAAPADDRELVALADALDRLTAEVRRQ